jgi:hypothetical protein
MLYNIENERVKCIKRQRSALSILISYNKETTLFKA